MQRPVKRRIEGEIPAPQFLVDDGTKLIIPAVLRKLPPLIPDFLRDAQAHRQVPRLRSRQPRANVIAHPVPTVAVLNARKHIKAGLEPVGPAVRDLQSLVLGVIRRGNAIDHLLRAVHGEVGMDFHHGDVLRRRFRGVDLDFVVVLGVSRQSEQKQIEREKGAPSTTREKCSAARCMTIRF